MSKEIKLLPPPYHQSSVPNPIQSSCSGVHCSIMKIFLLLFVKVLEIAPSILCILYLNLYHITLYISIWFRLSPSKVQAFLWNLLGIGLLHLTSFNLFTLTCICPLSLVLFASLTVSRIPIYFYIALSVGGCGVDFSR